MPFLVAGDPDLPSTAAMLPAIASAGAHICEVGFPFSDPIADGPVIQDSMQHALDRRTTPADIFAALSAVRDRTDLGWMAMVSYSIVHRIGGPRFVADAKAAGFDGFIVPDLPLEESEPFRQRAAAEGLVLSFLIAPSTPPDRARRIAAACTGFVYLLARGGVTGERTSLPADLPERVRNIRLATDLPVAVGFGVSAPEQVRAVVEVADAAIVGSALVRRIARNRQQPPEAVRAVERFVRELSAGLVHDPSQPTP